MAFENELQSYLERWIVEESKNRSQHILNGSCKTIEEYKARCAELNTLWSVSDQIAYFVRGDGAIRQEKNNGESQS